MQYPNGVHAQVVLEFQHGHTQPLELALGPSDAFGDLSGVIDRFVEAYCLSVNAQAFRVEGIRMCLFDPEELVVGFEADDDGCPDPITGMQRRFAFCFVSQMETARAALDPWLVVRPCTRDQVEAWHELMGLTGAQEVHVWCLDPTLQDWFRVHGE